MNSTILKLVARYNGVSVEQVVEAVAWLAGPHSVTEAELLQKMWHETETIGMSVALVRRVQGLELKKTPS
jgi:hypothetical protein